MISFDKLPTDKPNQNASVLPGRYLAVITKTEMVESQKTHDMYLRVTFTTKDKETIQEGFFEAPKPFNMYKIGRLLKATNVQLEGEGSLTDVAKLIMNKKVIIDIDVNDKGYANLNFNDKKEGVYARDEVLMDEVDETPVEDDKEEPVLDADVSNVIATSDEDF